MSWDLKRKLDENKFATAAETLINWASMRLTKMLADIVA